MKFFYEFLLLWSQFDLAIARATGRNPKHVAYLLSECARWEHELITMEINGWRK